MNIKTILALCAMASMATAAPAEEFEKRADPCDGKNRFCCETFFPVNIFFVRAVGSNCIGTLQSSAYPTGASDLCSQKRELRCSKEGVLLHQQSSSGKSFIYH
ncbi:unnamed protein product [Aspergillus oryzae]|uniref:Unnamed protein product n=2 Tax=Aspergillus oryzae TaxID=5062 RepID=A0AAN4YMX8_ASPOZ|nr:unnamed protein product [Aspergillus oryzae]GMF96429.1 unnamed protein product [Aspergillus oryzae]GMG05068.1 unnamed protein product [Aspergillus oryzae]GMG31139.1 unnamed protein product [Aspergillus oryzae]GMG54036.1 unnamed protein product [Aspergillus oryzae var. brunneus]